MESGGSIKSQHSVETGKPKPATAKKEGTVSYTMAKGVPGPQVSMRW